MNSSTLRRDAGLRIIETSRLLRSLVEQRLKPYGMTRAQYATLARLDRQDGLVQSELADMLEVQPIAMVRLADHLEGEGLIERRPDPQDRRCNRLHLTDAGRDRVAGLASFKAELAEELFDNISEAALDQMLRTLDQLHRNIKAVTAGESDTPRARKVVTA